MKETNEQVRDGIAQTAKRWRELNSKAGNPISHSEALDRVRRAREQGDRKRNEG
jgi:hypothetical protein